jgi:putative ABC transport system permease protein
MSHFVTQRKHEIGIRLALGANPKGIQRLIVLRALVLVAAGLILGMFGAWLISRETAAYMVGVNAHDVWSLLMPAGILVAVAVLASYLPAVRASRIDPAVTLRN